MSAIAESLAFVTQGTGAELEITGSRKSAENW